MVRAPAPKCTCLVCESERSSPMRRERVVAFSEVLFDERVGEAVDRVPDLGDLFVGQVRQPKDGTALFDAQHEG